MAISSCAAARRGRRTNTIVHRPAMIVSALLGLACLTGCKPPEGTKPPPPPRVTVMSPDKRDVVEYIEETGQVAAVKSVPLVARVQGFLTSIGYADGSLVEKGHELFVIEPAPYKAQVDKAEATLASNKAKALFATEQNTRFATLLQTDAGTQMRAQETEAAKKEADAAVLLANAALEQARITYSYTHVLAPFDGIVSAHQHDVGALVGGTGQATPLATIISLDPIWVDFTIDEKEVAEARAEMKLRGTTAADLHSVVVTAGLQGERGCPHKGHLDYTDAQLDASSGTLALRAVFDNPQRALLPGNFARVRMPIRTLKDALLVPDAAIGSRQGGRTLAIVDDDDIVEQRAVTIGPKDGDERVILSGLRPHDRVVVDGVARASPGDKVETVQAAPDDEAAAR